MHMKKWNVLIFGEFNLDPVLFGWEMALGNLIIGFLWCITIVGIPFGKKFLKWQDFLHVIGASVIG